MVMKIFVLAAILAGIYFFFKIKKQKTGRAEIQRIK